MTAELHAEIMNLPCNPPTGLTVARTAYVIGHREARHAAAELALSGAAVPSGNTPIAELLAQYTDEMCDFTNLEWVRKVAQRYVTTMPDSQVRCLLHVLAALSAPQQAASVPVGSATDEATLQGVQRFLAARAIYLADSTARELIALAAIPSRAPASVQPETSAAVPSDKQIDSIASNHAASWYQPQDATGCWMISEAKFREAARAVLALVGEGTPSTLAPAVPEPNTLQFAKGPCQSCGKPTIKTQCNACDEAPAAQSADFSCKDNAVDAALAAAYRDIAARDYDNAPVSLFKAHVMEKYEAALSQSSSTAGASAAAAKGAK